MFRSALMLLPIFGLIGLAFWFILPSRTSQPVLISDQVPLNNLTNLTKKIDQLEKKVDNLESSNSGLLSKLTILESGKSGNSYSAPAKKSQVLIPINPGGTLDAKDWKNLTSGSIKVDPKDYTGYKNAYLIIDLSVYVGQGRAFARLSNPDNGLSILESEVSTDSYFPITLTSKPFRLPAGSNNYTISVKTLVEGGYPAQAGKSFLQIVY